MSAISYAIIINLSNPGPQARTGIASPNKGAVTSDSWDIKLYLGATTVVKTISIELDF
jgi:hypothetical protein